MPVEPGPESCFHGRVNVAPLKPIVLPSGLAAEAAFPRSSERGSIEAGWGRDEAQTFNKWVLYVDLPEGQVSFHSPERYEGPDYPGQWDGRRLSEERIISFCQRVFEIVRC